MLGGVVGWLAMKHAPPFQHWHTFLKALSDIDNYSHFQTQQGYEAFHNSLVRPYFLGENVAVGSYT